MKKLNISIYSSEHIPLHKPITDLLTHAKLLQKRNKTPREFQNKLIVTQYLDCTPESQPIDSVGCHKKLIYIIPPCRAGTGTITIQWSAYQMLGLMKSTERLMERPFVGISETRSVRSRGSRPGDRMTVRAKTAIGTNLGRRNTTGFHRRYSASTDSVELVCLGRIWEQNTTLLVFLTPLGF
ncbi:hypothetical protein J6590_076353 [Homalodisca vitripennis]|nr:hypothetical protein J6590_076353 [Homalodisca vitripennis]